jgi:hypothetical protein
MGEILGSILNKIRGGKNRNRGRSVDSAVQTINRNLAVVEGKLILAARISKLDPERITEIKEIAAKADKEGKFPKGSLTYDDYHKVALASAELQNIEMPPNLKEAGNFAYHASGQITKDVSDQVVIKGQIGPKVTIGRLRVSIDNELRDEWPPENSPFFLQERK